MSSQGVVTRQASDWVTAKSETVRGSLSGKRTEVTSTTSGPRAPRSRAAARAASLVSTGRPVSCASSNRFGVTMRARGTARSLKKAATSSGT